MSKEKSTTADDHNLKNKRTQWHMAVTPAMKLEFKEYSQILDYIPEYLLNVKALQIDLLVIKKDGDALIENEIGRIFQHHNIIEYKSPHDKEGVNTYFKVYAYASLYKIGEGSTACDSEEITITMMRRGKPYKLFQWFEQHGCRVSEEYKGVYYIENAGFFRTQVIVARELDKKNHIWLKALTDNMDREQAQNLINKSKELMDQPEAGYVEAVLQIVSKANKELFETLKKEEKDMYSALVELMQPEIDEAVNAAVKRTWDEATNETTARMTVEAIENAIKKLSMSKEEACAFMDTTVAEYDAYRQIIENAAARTNKKE
ncbi:MAG: hypothetical protein K2I96_02830 [Lachnospiraceae bacterium]|nr:hypothetical protein [Lachnospiraceae bacterium]